MDGDCVFCRAFESANDATTATLWRRERSFALLNVFPYTSGHCMVAPIAHTGDFTSLDDETLAEMMIGARDLMSILGDLYHAHGFNVGINVGEAGGAGIAEHLHLHIVPRWNADTNFMAVVGDTRVIPEAIETSFERIRGAVDKREKGSG